MGKRPVGALDFRGRQPKDDPFLGERVERSLGVGKLPKIVDKFQIIPGLKLPKGISIPGGTKPLKLLPSLFAMAGPSGSKGKATAGIGAAGGKAGAGVAGGATAGAAGGGKKGGGGPNDELSFFSLRTAGAILFGTITNLYHIFSGFLLYSRAKSQVANGQIKEAVASFKEAIKEFKKAGRPDFEGHVYTRFGFVVKGSPGLYSKSSEADLALRTIETYSAFREAYEAFQAAKDEKNAQRNLMLAASISQKYLVKPKILEQFETVKDSIPVNVLDIIILEMATVWKKGETEEVAVKYGLPPALGQLPIKLIVEALIEHGYFPLAEKLSKEAINSEINITVRVGDVFIYNWLEENAEIAFPGVPKDVLRSKIVKRLPALIIKIKDFLSQKNFRDDYVRTGSDGVWYITSQGIGFALTQIYEMADDLRSITGSIDQPGRILGVIMERFHGQSGSEIQTLVEAVELIIKNPGYTKFYENGIITEVGVKTALAEALNEKPTKGLAGGAESPIYEEHSVVFGPGSPAKAIETLLDEPDTTFKPISFEGWTSLGESRGIALRWIGRVIRAEHDKNRIVIENIEGGGIRIFFGQLQIALNKVILMLKLEPILLAIDSKLRTIDENTLYSTLLLVIEVMQRNDFADAFDDDGNPEPKAVEKAYKIIEERKTRKTDQPEDL